MTICRTASIVSCLLVLSFLASSLAYAAGRSRDAGKELSDQAATQFKDGKFLQAAELFERAFALNPEKLVRLRNAGRALEEGGRPEHAHVIFQRYLDLAPEGQDKAEVRERMAHLEVQLMALPTNPPVVVAPPVVAVHAPAPRSRAVAWGLVGSGAALAVAGGVWLAMVADARARFDADRDAGHYSYPGVGDKQNADSATLATNSALAWTTVGVGVAATAFGLYDALRAEPTGVAVRPWFGSQQTGVALAGRF